MSVVSVNEIESVFTEAQDGNRQYVATYEIISNSILDSIADIYQAYGLPQRGETYDFNGTYDPLAVCLTRTFKYRSVKEGRKVWTCTANFDSKGSKDDPQNKDKHPLDWAWKFTGSYLSRMLSPEKDINDRAPQNVNGEDFLPPPEADDPISELQAEKNTSTISLATWTAYRNSVNNATFWGLPARAIKLAAWSWNPMYTDNGQGYIANKFTLHVKRGVDGDLWNYRPLNQGFTEAVWGAHGKTVRQILDERSIPISKPKLLDALGAQNAEGLPPVWFDGEGGNPDPFEFEVEKDFSAIFPSSLPYPITT
jgi:hypothetical protein